MRDRKKAEIEDERRERYLELLMFNQTFPNFSDKSASIISLFRSVYSWQTLLGVFLGAAAAAAKCF